MNKKWLIAAFLIVILFNGILLYQYNRPEGKGISAFASFFDFFDVLFKSTTSIAQLMVQVVIAPPNITIQSPANTTYYFNSSQSFDVNLNVSSDRGDVQSWWYKLYNQSGTLVYNNILFTPNTSFTAVLNGNTLAVFANISNGIIGNSNVTFSVRISQSTPIIENLSSSILACEDTYLSYVFNISDADEEVLTVSMTPVNPFFITKLSQSGNRTAAEIFSGTLSKGQAGNYSETVSASDGTRADTDYTNITVVPVNHGPALETIGVQTIWFNDNFYKQVNANDTEEGNVTQGNLTFNITFISGNSIFSINTTHGIMNYTANSSAVGNYNISVCVTDNGLNTTTYPNASYCGYSGSASYNCTSFQFTITNQNRAPNITSWYPSNLTHSGDAPLSFAFNVSASDADGTTPDIYWYVTSVLEKSLSTHFNRTFTQSGTYNVTAIATDGELNTSKSWTIAVSGVTTSPISGGGGSGVSCNEKWACDDTSVCQSLDAMYRQKLLDDDTRGAIEYKCKFFGWSDKECGIKILNCKDVNKCGTAAKRPNLIEACFYVPNPSCSDGVKNCHDNACEVLVDCGGSCQVCPTCSDSIQNQGEENIDCGGPCPNACPIEKPKKTNSLVYILTALILGLVAAIVFTAYRLFAIRKRVEESKY